MRCDSLRLVSTHDLASSAEGYRRSFAWSTYEPVQRRAWILGRVSTVALDSYGEVSLGCLCFVSGSARSVSEMCVREGVLYTR